MTFVYSELKYLLNQERSVCISAWKVFGDQTYIRTDTRWELSWKIIFLLDKEMWVRRIRLSLVQFIISMWTKAGQSTEGTGTVISLIVPDPVLVPGVHLLSFSGNWKLQQKCFAVLLSKPRNKKIKYDPELRIVNWL